MRNKGLFALLALLSLAATPLCASDIMPLSEIRKGMKGYGLTVFEGDRTEKFDVEILGVLENIGPDRSLILARVDHPILRNSGVVAGMSGSPIYIDGRVIGALAYGWQFAKEPITGITPIEEMLRIGTIKPVVPGGAPVGPTIPASVFLNEMTTRDPVAMQKRMESLLPSRNRALAGGASPIAIPLSFSSFAPETLDRFSGMLMAGGFIPAPSGSAAAGKQTATASTSLKAGDAFAGVLVDGDFSIAATGTVTHVDGEKVYGFGHPFLDIGEISFPMAKADVIAVMSSLERSFKFSNSGAIVGALKQDRTAGVMGVVGADANMLPVKFSLENGDASRTYNLRVIRHPQLLPSLLAMVSDSIVSNANRAAGERTLMMNTEIKLAGYDPIRLSDGWAGNDARQAVPAYLAIISSYLLSNEFEETRIESINVNLRHDDSVRVAQVIEAAVETPQDGEINPGDKIRIRALLRPFRGEVFSESFDLTIPDSQAAGNVYVLVGSGTSLNQIDFLTVPPDPRSLKHVIDVLDRIRASTELSVGMYSPSEGAVTGGAYFPSLPPSVRAMVVMDASNAAQAAVKYHGTNYVSKTVPWIVAGAVKVDLAIKPRV